MQARTYLTETSSSGGGHREDSVSYRSVERFSFCFSDYAGTLRKMGRVCSWQNRERWPRSVEESADITTRENRRETFQLKECIVCPCAVVRCVYKTYVCPVVVTFSHLASRISSRRKRVLPPLATRRILFSNFRRSMRAQYPSYANVCNR